jgi:hypothetical protein
LTKKVAALAARLNRKAMGRKIKMATIVSEASVSDFKFVNDGVVDSPTFILDLSGTRIYLNAVEADKLVALGQHAMVEYAESLKASK